MGGCSIHDDSLPEVSALLYLPGLPGRILRLQTRIPVQQYAQDIDGSRGLRHGARVAVPGIRQVAKRQQWSPAIPFSGLSRV
jgi:hypothetical protein